MELIRLENNILYFMDKINKIIYKQSITKRRISEAKQKIEMLSKQEKSENKENIKQKNNSNKKFTAESGIYQLENHIQRQEKYLQTLYQTRYYYLDMLQLQYEKNEAARQTKNPIDQL